MARAIRRIDCIQRSACRAAARERFSADRMIGQYLSLYERLARHGAIKTVEASG
jgi:glycosyltransferase involved in cell wall biosynthesis